MKLSKRAAKQISGLFTRLHVAEKMWNKAVKNNEGAETVYLWLSDYYETVCKLVEDFGLYTPECPDAATLPMAKRRAERTRAYWLEAYNERKGRQ